MNRRLALWTAVMVGVAVAAGCAKADPVDTAQVKQDAMNLIVDGRLDEALGELKQVSASEKSDSEVHFLIGLAEYNRKNYEAALQAYRLAAKVDPGRGEVHNNIGNTLRDMGDVQGALNAYKQAIVVEKTLANPHLNLYLLLRDQGLIPEALQVMEHASLILPDNLSVQLNLAAAYDLAGDKVRAAQTQELVKRKFPNARIPGITTP